MIQLRSIQENDMKFIESVYRSTREAELALTNWSEQQKQAFTVMQSMAQLAEYKKNYPGAVYQIITYNKKDAGRFYTWETENDIRIIDITVLPAYRGKKIAAYLLNKMIERSNTVQKKLSLHVLPHNPVLQFYRRLGFEIIKTNGAHFYMERKPRKD